MQIINVICGGKTACAVRELPNPSYIWCAWCSFWCACVVREFKRRAEWYIVEDGQRLKHSCHELYNTIALLGSCRLHTCDAVIEHGKKKISENRQMTSADHVTCFGADSATAARLQVRITWVSKRRVPESRVVSFTVRERPRSRPGRVRVGRHRNKMAPHSAGRGACGTFTPNQRFLRRSVNIWACLLYYGNRHDAARKSAARMECTGKNCDRRAQLPSRETWSQRMVSSGNPSHAKQEDLLKHVHQKRKKKEKRKKTQGTFNTSFGKHDISAAPHTGQPPTGTAANFAASLVTADDCRQDIPKASGTGKLHVNASLTLARKQKNANFPAADDLSMFSKLATLISPKLDGRSTQFKRWSASEFSKEAGRAII